MINHTPNPQIHFRFFEKFAYKYKHDARHLTDNFDKLKCDEKMKKHKCQASASLTQDIQPQAEM